MSDTEFWTLVCRGMILILKAIIRKHGLSITLFKDTE